VVNKLTATAYFKIRLFSFIIFVKIMLKKSIQFENLKTHLSGTNVCNYMYYQKCTACYLRAGQILIHIEAIVQFK